MKEKKPVLRDIIIILLRTGDIQKIFKVLKGKKNYIQNNENKDERRLIVNNNSSQNFLSAKFISKMKSEKKKTRT